jgi:hypothetical protein
VEQVRRQGYVPLAGEAFRHILDMVVHPPPLLNQDDAGKIATMKRFGKLAREGNALIRGYERCQACEAIKAVAQTLTDRNR